MTPMETSSVEESVLRSAHAFLYGHPLAWERPGERTRGIQGRARRRRLSGLRVALFRARGRRSDVAEAGGCA
jgi:hypothetical protein